MSNQVKIKDLEAMLFVVALISDCSIWTGFRSVFSFYKVFIPFASVLLSFFAILSIFPQLD